MTAPQTEQPGPGDTQSRYGSRQAWLDAQEKQRQTTIRECRQYYSGTMYDEDNEQCRRELLADARRGEKSLVRTLFDEYHLPEHMRRHAYSSQVAESVNWIADRLAQDFNVDAAPEAVNTIVQSCLDNTPELAAGDEDTDRTVALVLREAATAGDVPVLIRWDTAAGACWLEFWDSEQVQLGFVDGRPDEIASATVRQIDWRPVDGRTQQVTLRREWTVDDGDDGRRCVERVYLDDQGNEYQDRPVEEHDWAVPFLPWTVVRVQRDELRATRGSSLINPQIRRTADRYNAVEQVSWLIARYNSHGNLVVVGDTAMLAGDDKIHKDVADVLKFPGGTSATPISLPTDPAMIEHQKETLTDALYARFGLVRTDTSTVSNLGEVSGYALEILNSKAENTFGRIRSQLVKDLKKVFNLVVDCHQSWAAGDAAEGGRASVTGGDGSLSEAGAGLANRSITVRLGTGWVVDEAAARDDYLAGAISRREFLRVKGKSEDQIDDILDEIAEETRESDTVSQSLRPGETGRLSTQTGQTLNAGTVAGNGARR